jgi:superfamily II DNA or RNA helicase
MSNEVLPVKIKSVRHASNPQDYLLYKAALEWDLIDPIIIEKRADLKSTAFWQDKVEPCNHQVSNLISFCRRLPVTLLADDVGLGKTISAGLVASELIARDRLSKILIVCPKILGPQWKEELETKFGIPAQVVTGRELLTTEPPEDVGAIITTYNSARMYIDSLEHIGYDMLILDEAHKLRNLYGTDSPPQVALKIKEALANRWFKYVLLLTATPIQNRLWDLYSLVELLTVARGHENPFGSPGMFARKFIADNKSDARKLNPKAEKEFRGIIYNYMSRVRRGDADLHFPQREVHLHSVEPSLEELEVISIVSDSIADLNRLTQIGILKTLVSSPEALLLMLKNMAENGTIEKSFYQAIDEVVQRISVTAKLEGLESLVDKLRAEKPNDWRVVIFTTRLETQTSIQNFLENKNINCGIINGTTGSSNVETLNLFKKETPDINVIISTEAGAEGVNMQSANVLVNYDLPWNPMVVEQRIGRIQRLGSPHEKVIVFNLVLDNTFEEYIVGRLMEKLQLASSAIGDIESLLEASGIAENDDSGKAFEDKILNLVLDSLKGKDMRKAAERTALSIEKAKDQLRKEESNINSLLGKMGDDMGPRCPKLPKTIQSMQVKDFVVEGLISLGAKVTERTPALYLSEIDGEQEVIRFDNNLSLPVPDGSLFKNTLYAPGSPAFEKLVVALTSVGLHRVEDDEKYPAERAEEVAAEWIKSFSGKCSKIDLLNARKSFSGSALVRARITVAHDSYERLVEVICSHSDHIGPISDEALDVLPDKSISDFSLLGISEELLSKEVMEDGGVSEFHRFYSERLIEELKGAGESKAKIKKLENDFTPRVELTLVGLEGLVRRQLSMKVSYTLASEHIYSSTVTVTPSLGEMETLPKMQTCEESKIEVPSDCLKVCDFSGTLVLNELLVPSELSGRNALVKHTQVCAVTGKKVLLDELEKSDVTGDLVIPTHMKTSAVSGKKAEPSLFDLCEFTQSELLKSELLMSQVSNKKYREDESLISAVSGSSGHRSEFIRCVISGDAILSDESEVCEVSKKHVTVGLLEECEVTKKKVLPKLLDKSSLSGKKALKKFFESSSLSEAIFLETEGIKSSAGKYCLPLEAQSCTWDAELYHSDDILMCKLSNLPYHFKYIVADLGGSKFKVLKDLLEGTLRSHDVCVDVESVSVNIANTLKKNKFELEYVKFSPDGSKLAICVLLKSLLGFKTKYLGVIYSLTDSTVMGRIAKGSRTSIGWVENK